MNPPTILVFGGNGFVGSAVCEEVVRTGLRAVSVNRSGPPKAGGDWVSKVEWVRVRHACPQHHRQSHVTRTGLLPLACWRLTQAVAVRQADVFDKAAWRDRLPTALGVISCLGAFGSNDFM